MKYFFHVTTLTNWHQIKTFGLTHQGSRRGSGFEDEQGIYLFNSMEDAADGVANWLGDEFEDDEHLVLLKISLPETFLVEIDPELNLSASICRMNIPTEFIEVENSDF